MKIIYTTLLLLALGRIASAQVNPKLWAQLDKQVKDAEPRLVEWRRYFHEHPELSNREFKTGARVAELLKSWGLEVQYPVAKTGVVALLKGGKPGPVVALRADMDALPIVERNSLPFASREKAVVGGQETGVMHACGHDAHMSMLLAVAEILSRNKAELSGSVKFLFQPAEEGVSPAESPAGAELMVKEGVLENPKVDVVFGLHIQSLLPSGQIAYRAGGLMAAVDGFDIKVTGVGAHGATPWDSVDPVVVSSQVLGGLQTIVSRQSELTKGPVVITVGSLHAGVRRNIIPEEAKLEGTIRTFDEGMQKKVHADIIQTATNIAEASGAKANVDIQVMYPVTYNDPGLTEQVVPSLHRAVGANNVKVTAPVTMAEDFSFFQKAMPSFFFFLGAYPSDMQLEKQPTHHTADFMIDEKAMGNGVRALLSLTLDYMNSKSRK